MIVILTALQSEYIAIRRQLTGVRIHSHPAGTLFETGVVRGRRVAIAVVGEGNIPAAAITERAIAEFEPTAVLFVGIAGGLADWIDLGDVVVATRIYSYQGGRSTDHAFRTRPRVWDSAHQLEQVARSVAVTETWRSGLSTSPRVHFGPIAAGEVLLDSTLSSVATYLQDRYDDAVAIEMESAGMANAGHLNNAPTLTIRGISDFADGSADQDAQRRSAAEHAATFAVAVIARLEEAGPPPRERRGGTTGHNVRNQANGNSRVINQIGVVQGDVRIVGTTGSTLPSDRIREAVFAEFRVGRLDRETLDKAMQNIDQLDSGPGAMRRLYELVKHRPQLAELVLDLASGGA